MLLPVVPLLLPPHDGRGPGPADGAPGDVRHPHAPPGHAPAASRLAARAGAGLRLPPLLLLGADRLLPALGRDAVLGLERVRRALGRLRGLGGGAGHGGRAHRGGVRVGADRYRRYLGWAKGECD